METFLSTTLSALAVALVVFIAQRFLPSARWSRQLALDAAILSQLPSGQEREEFEIHVRRQAKRLSMYRSRMTGANLAVTVVTWAIILIFTGGIATLIGLTTFGGGTFAAAIAGAEWLIAAGILAVLGYAIFQCLGAKMVRSLAKQELGSNRKRQGTKDKEQRRKN